MTTSIPQIPLTTESAATGTTIPQLGFGVWQVEADQAQPAVATALETGYRHIDTAAMYKNEEGVGKAVQASGLSRDDIFVTTKLWNDQQGPGKVRPAFEASLQRLGLDRLDLYLMHWPAPAGDNYVGAWEQMLELQRAGLTRAVGVCNFQTTHLQRLQAETSVFPCINQIELHPQLTQEPLRTFDTEHGIVTEDWSPLASGGDVLQDPTIATIAKAHDKTPGQVILRWHVQLGSVVIPKSVTPSRIRENFALFDFELTDDEMAAISGLNKDQRTGPNPDEFNLGAE